MSTYKPQERRTSRARQPRRLPRWAASAVAALSIVVVGTTGTTGTPAEAQPLREASAECPTPGAVVPLESTSALLTAAVCDLTGVGLSAAGYNSPIWVPKVAVGAGGVQDFAEPIDRSFVIAHAKDGQVGLIVNEKVIGSVSALKELKFDGWFPEQSPTMTTSSRIFRLADLPGSHRNIRCGSAQPYRKYGPKWAFGYDWWYNADSSQGSGSIDRVKGSMNTWLNGNTDCTSDINNTLQATYQAGGQANGYHSKISSSGGCPASAPGHSVVDWGSTSGASGSLLGVTCFWNNSVSLTEADVKLTTTYGMYLGASSTGCTGSLYDLQDIITHEFGHAIGLKHSVNETGTPASNYWQTMKPNQGSCDTESRWLGYGDAQGAASIYG